MKEFEKTFIAAAVKHGFLTAEQAQAASSALESRTSDRTIGEILVGMNLLTWTQFKEIITLNKQDGESASVDEPAINLDEKIPSPDEFAGTLMFSAGDFFDSKGNIRADIVNTNDDAPEPVPAPPLRPETKRGETSILSKHLPGSRSADDPSVPSSKSDKVDGFAATLMIQRDDAATPPNVSLPEAPANPFAISRGETSFLSKHLPPDGQSNTPKTPQRPPTDGMAQTLMIQREDVPDLPGSGARDALRIRPGDKIGRVVIRELLEETPVATIYLAEQESIGKRVALKVLQPALAKDPTVLERFRREARASGGIGHPGIIDVFDIGEQDGLNYIEMAYVEGETLQDRLRRAGRLSLTDALAFASQIADALRAAHAKSVVHRDIQPLNILIDKRQNVVIREFGMAHFSNDARLTMPGVAMGSPAYAPPEQWDGAELDERADIYALGAVLFAMLSGRPPFDSDNLGDVLAAVKTKGIPQLSDVVSDAPKTVSDFVSQLMKRQPDERPADMDEVIRLLDDVKVSTNNGTDSESLLKDATSGAGQRRSDQTDATLLLSDVEAGAAARRAQKTDPRPSAAAEAPTVAMDASKYPFVNPSARKAPVAPSGAKAFVIALLVALLILVAAFAIITFIPSLRKSAYPFIGLSPSDAEGWFGLAPVVDDAPVTPVIPQVPVESKMKPSIEIARAIWKPIRDTLAASENKDNPAALCALARSMQASSTLRSRIDDGSLDDETIADLRKVIALAEAYDDLDDAFALIDRRKQYPRMDYDTQAFSVLAARSALLTQDVQSFGASVGMDVKWLRDRIGVAMFDATALIVERQLADARRIARDSSDAKRLEAVISAYNALASNESVRLSALVDFDARIPHGFVLDENRKKTMNSLNRDWLDDKTIISAFIEISSLIDAENHAEAWKRLTALDGVLDENGQTRLRAEYFNGLRIDLSARAVK
ncbi:MAG: serine/threonine-protein kinase [Planctomycetota bacterium]